MIQVVLTAALLVQAPPAPAATRLASIQVKGTKRYTAEEVTRLSGLAIGKTIAVADLAAAANRLAATGLFDSVRYTYTTGPATAVTFEIAEAAWAVPVLFDNFVWFADDELKNSLKNDVPSFDGSAPLNAGAAEFIGRALQKLLESRGIPGRVDFTARHDIKRESVGYLYAVKDPSPKLCSVRISGAAAIAERDLVEPLKAAAGGDYSRSFLATAAAGTLTDIYRRKGYWRAKFGVPIAALDPCGVSVTLPLDEGPQYTWAGAAWAGTTVMSSDALDKLLGIKVGEVADLSKLDSGLRAVHAAYAQKGYITQGAAFEPKLDDAARKATFSITVDEGPQFHMGTLTIPGIRESDAATLAKRWPLKPGEVYDQSQVIKYEREVLGPLQTSAGGRAQLQEEPFGDRVNVTIVFR